MDSCKIEGFDKVIANLNKEIMAIENRTMRGLILGAALIRRETEHGTVKTPVDLGNLRASWFVVTANSVPVGKGVANFNGPQLTKLCVAHITTIQESQALLKAGGKKLKAIICGYSAPYATWVHENVDAGHGQPSRRGNGKMVSGWNRKGSGPK